jgi:glycosyltransferase involved in cell wall biosynthesis
MNFPDDTRTRVHGIFQRLRLFVDAFGGLGELDFLFFVEPRIDVSPESVEHYQAQLSSHYGMDVSLSLVTRMIPAKQSRWEAYGAGMFDAYRQYGFRWASGPEQTAALAKALDRKPDLLFVHRLSPMGAVENVGGDLPPMFFDLDDVEHRAFARSIPHPPSWPGKKLYYLQVPTLWRAERRAIRQSERTFVCSEEDRSYLTRTMRVDGVSVIPNAVAMPEPSPPAPEKTVMFIGVLSYAPNRNAAGLLVNEIWPKVRKLVPDAQLLIAGSYAEQVEGFPGGNGVTFTGFVDDLEDLYARTQVVCVPIATGGGTRIKIIEAVGHGRPVVSTPIGAEGLDMIDGEHILLREEPSAIAEALATLLLDDERGRAIGMAGREVVRDTYDRNNVIEKIREEVRSALG